MKDITITIFVITVVLIFQHMARNIHKNFKRSAQLNRECKAILDIAETSDPTSVETDLNIYLFDLEGTTVYIDTDEGFKDGNGKPTDEHHEDLYTKMKNEHYLNTRQIIKENMQVLSVVKLTGKKYCLLGYIRT